MTEVTLDVVEHFATLREPVWVRVRGRNGGLERERFEDAYAEWWSREVERSAAGRPSVAAAPAAFVAEAVHRTLIDELRSRARGLSRGAEKTGLEFVDIDDQLDVAAAEATPAQAAYEALAHRVLGLVRDRLSGRELRVFVWTYLYLRSTPETAVGLGLSEPRVKKDRKRIAGKIGAEVWQLLGTELALCAEYSEQRVTAAFEGFVAHAEDCAECSRSVGGLRAGAYALLGPLELLALDGGEGRIADLVNSLVVRLTGLVHRATGTAMAMPAGGKAAAVAAVGAVAVAGGTAALPPAPKAAPPPRVAVATPTTTATPAPTSVATATPTPAPSASTRRRARTRPAPAPTASSTTAPVVARVTTARSAPPAPAEPDPGEFAFERD